MGLEGQVRAMSAAGNALSSNAFAAEMIAPSCDAGTGGPGCFVARDFSLETVETGTILHLSAQGLYRAFLNGQRVGDDLLTPGWTCYDDRIAYQSYDVSALLKPGKNRLEIWLGDGWYRSRLMWALNPIPNTWGSRIGAFAELVARGKTLIKTDASWASGFTPVTGNGIYHGEDFDARIGVADTHGVEILPFDRSLLVPHETAAVKEMDRVAPLESWADEETTVYDFGQNCGAYARDRGAGSGGRACAGGVLGSARSEPRFRQPQFPLGPGRAALHGEGRRRGDLRAALHLLRLPLRSRHTDRRSEASGDPPGPGDLGPRSGGRVHLWRGVRQPAGPEHDLVAAVELHRDPDRLPAAG